VHPDQRSSATPESKRPARRRKIRNALLAIGVGLIVALVGGELALRFILFTPSVDLGGLGGLLRQPRHYSDGNSEDDFWKLLCKFQGAAALADMPQHDAVTGWTNTLVRPETYASVDEDMIRGRRPVLLYGDSFAQCLTLPGDRFQSIFERSEFARDHVLLNYGVGGYGLDQIYLLLKSSLDRFQGQNPIVIVSVLVEGDFDRSVLSFRAWPKPRLEIVDDQLVTRGPVQTSVREYLAQNPVTIRSYLWRLFLYQGSSFLSRQRAQWRVDAQIEAEKRSLNRRILLEIERELSSRKLEHFYLAFHVEDGALEVDESCEWEERLLQEFCAESGARFVDTRDFLSSASDARPKQCAQFYGRGEPLQGHHNGLGNLVCFEAIRHGMRGAASEPRSQYQASANKYGMIDWIEPQVTTDTFLKRGVTLTTHGSGAGPFAMQTFPPMRLVMRADALGSTLVQFELAAPAKRFTGKLHAVAEADRFCTKTELRFCADVDGVVVLDQAVPPANNPLALDIDLDGKTSLTFALGGDRGGAGCNWVCIEDPRFE